MSDLKEQKLIDICNVKVRNLGNGVYELLKTMEEGEIYHFKFRINKFDDRIDFGYCGYHDEVKENNPCIKILNDKSEVFDGTEITSIKGNVGVYEVIYDMITNRMSIKQGNGEVVEVCSIDSDMVMSFVRVSESSDNEIRLIEYWKLPLIIQRYTIYNPYVDNNVYSFQTSPAELYDVEREKFRDRIEYVVCNKIFQHLAVRKEKNPEKDKEKEKEKYNYTINIEMKENDGIYHFYYEIMSVGTAGIRFGYCQNRGIANERLVQSKVAEIYEVIYDMIHMQMCIKKDGSTVVSPQTLPTSTDSLVLIKPCISTGDRGGSVKLTEYYKEREDYGFNDISIYKNTRIDEIKDYRGYNAISTVELGLPNSIYGIYNYEKYYVRQLLEYVNARNTDITPIKEIIKSRFRLNNNQKKYIDESDITDLMIFLNCYGDEDINLDLSDSFAKIVNSLSVVNHIKLNEDGSVKQGQEKKYLGFASTINGVFQFPKNEIYIRDCYYTMFRDICKCLSPQVKKLNVIVTGQPGIGKTSFIYVLLFLIKNLYKMEELIKEMKGIINNLNDLGLINSSELNLEKDINKIIEEINAIEARDSLKSEVMTAIGNFKTKVDELNVINEYTKYLGKLGIQFDNKTLDDTWRKKDGKLKDIYIIKGKRNGDLTDMKKYLFRDGYVFKVNIHESQINDSIIIVDTFNKQFGNNNKIISISSPELNNYREYEKNVNNYKELYFDSLNKTEIKEWFNYCSGFNVNVASAEFNEVCERYGYIPRQIYYHYLYDRNYIRDYWDYYKQLIEGVIGTIGYNDFKNKYLDRQYLKNHPLSNIILKFNLQLKNDADLGYDILQPEDELIYISKSVKNYIKCKFYPPMNDDECKKLENDYRELADGYMKRMASKQIIAYKLSTNEIQINTTVKKGKKNQFKLKSQRQLSICYNNDVNKLVHFILDENNFFDLIMNGVFIKVLLDDGIKFDKENIPLDIKMRMIESIKDYSENDDNNFEYCVIIYSPPSSPTIIYKEDMKFKASNKGSKSSPSSSSSSSSSSQNEIQNFESCDANYLMRKCYKDMLKIICKGLTFKDLSFQRNYLIFGNKGIGKKVLAKILLYNISENVEKGIEVLIDSPDYLPNNNYKSKPYIVIVYGKAVGEDDYADAKMVIMLSSPSDEKCKTFQSKRCPLLMYIPPFTEAEVKEYVKLEYPSNVDHYEELYINNYEYYGGIIGNFTPTDAINMEKLIECVDKGIMKEMVEGINKSPLSKGDYERIIIYETDENDVTKSGNLRFISKIIRDMVFNILFKDVEGCEIMMETLRKNQTGGRAGEFYEGTIFYLMKNLPTFLSHIVREMNELISEKFKDNSKEINTIIEMLKREVFVSDEKNEVRNADDLKERIINYQPRKEISFIPLSYKSNFPDIDGFIGPIAIQTTISDKHSYAPEMTMILQNLYKIYTVGYNEAKKSFGEIDKDQLFFYFLISVNDNVTINPNNERDIKTYATILRLLLKDEIEEDINTKGKTLSKLNSDGESVRNTKGKTLSKLSSDEKKILFNAAEENKFTIKVTIEELDNYCQMLKDKRLREQSQQPYYEGFDYGYYKRKCNLDLKTTKYKDGYEKGKLFRDEVNRALFDKIDMKLTEEDISLPFLEYRKGFEYGYYNNKYRNGKSKYFNKGCYDGIELYNKEENLQSSPSPSPQPPLTQQLQPPPPQQHNNNDDDEPFSKRQWIQSSSLPQQHPLPSPDTVLVNDVGDTCGIERYFHNTCYMNSTLQCLAHIKPFRDCYIPKGRYSNNIENEFSNLFNSLCNSTTTILYEDNNFQNFRSAIDGEDFKVDTQQDVLHFLGILLNHLNSAKRLFNEKLEMIDCYENKFTKVLVLQVSIKDNEKEIVKKNVKKLLRMDEDVKSVVIPIVHYRKELIVGNYIYDLKGISCYHGHHYIAVCKSTVDENFYVFNDDKIDNISALEEDKYKEFVPYLFYYELRKGDEEVKMNESDENFLKDILREVKEN